MDNNILCSSQLDQIVKDLNALGFVKNCKNYVKPNEIDIAIKKLERRINYGNSLIQPIREIRSDILSLNENVISSEFLAEYREIKNTVDTIESKNFYSFLKKNENVLTELFKRYKRRTPLQRFVDFNQGIDARLISDDNMKILSGLPLKPFRLAYDHYALRDVYEKAFRTAYNNGVRYFSNYMLYNYNETPEELWMRMEHNIRLNKELPDVHLFSFPMKYAPIDRIDRNYIGKYWSKKQLSAMNVILNVTKGVVMGEEDFFYRAFGNSPKDFLRILAMPSEFIKFRSFFEKNGKIKDWGNEYDMLNEEQRRRLLEYLSDINIAKCDNVEADIASIIRYYHISKKSCEIQE